MKFEGQLQNAPLLFVLAAVRFTPVLKLEKYINEFQDRIRKEYPLVEVNNVESIEIRFDKGNVEPIRETRKVWNFLSADRTWGLVVEQHQILFHTRAYTRFADMAARIEYLLRHFKDTVDPSHYLNASIRYIDLIAPNEREKISDFLPEQMFLRHIDGVAGQQTDSFSASSFKTELGNLVVRCWLNSPQAFPTDLGPLFAIMKYDVPRPASDFAVLDTDHVESQAQIAEFDCARVIHTLDELHKVSRKVFEGVPNPHAFDVWKLEN